MFFKSASSPPPPCKGDVDGNENKGINWTSKTTTLHMQTTFCSFLSLPSLYDYGVKMPNFSFYGRSRYATTNFVFCPILDMVLREWTPREIADFWNNCGEDYMLKNANSLFKRRFYSRRRRGILTTTCNLNVCTGFFSPPLSDLLVALS